MLASLGGRAGELVLSSWGFPAALLAVPVRSLEFGRSHHGAADYADLVGVAVLVLDRQYEGPYSGIDRRRVGAFARLGFDADTDWFAQPGFADQYHELLAALTH